MNFPGKRSSSVFKYSSYLPSCKNPEKINDLPPRKMPNRQKTTVILEDPLLDRGPQKQVKSKTKVSVFVLFKLC